MPFVTGNEMSVAIPPPPIAVKPVRTSRIMEGNLIRRVQPTYPALARQGRIQGSVVLSAVISRDGMIERLQVLNGQPLLEQAAIEAVRQWRYRPTLAEPRAHDIRRSPQTRFGLLRSAAPKEASRDPAAESAKMREGSQPGAVGRAAGPRRRGYHLSILRSHSYT